MAPKLEFIEKLIECEVGRALRYVEYMLPLLMEAVSASLPRLVLSSSSMRCVERVGEMEEEDAEEAEDVEEEEEA